MKTRVFVIVSVLVLVLTACGGVPEWRIATEGDACTSATVVEKMWSDKDTRNFYLLLKAEDGEMGMSWVSAYVYVALEEGEQTCVIR